MSVRSSLGRVRALPPARRFLAIAAVVGLCDVLLYLPLVALTSLVGDGPVDWAAPVAPLLGGFLGALLAQAVVLWWRRRQAGEAQRAARRPFETATRTGRLPADADPVVWTPLLVDRLAGQRRRTVVAVAVLAVLTVAVAVLLVVSTDLRPFSLVVVTVAHLQLLSAVWAAGERRRQRLAGMLERLAARAADGRPADR